MRSRRCSDIWWRGRNDDRGVSATAHSASTALLTTGYLFGGIFTGLGAGLVLGSRTGGGGMQAARTTGAGVVGTAIGAVLRRTTG